MHCSSEVVFENGLAGDVPRGEPSTSELPAAEPSEDPPDSLTAVTNRPPHLNSRMADAAVPDSMPMGLADVELPSARPLSDINADLLSPGFTATASSIGTHAIPKGIPEHCEEAFFLRIFCEGPARW